MFEYGAQSYGGSVGVALATPTPITLSDSATASDGVSIVVTVGVNDSVMGTDTILESASAIISDSGGGTDTVVASLSVPVTDSTTGTDTISSRVTIPVTDSGVGIDGVACRGNVSIQDPVSNYSKTITFNHTKVSADLLDFPVLIHLQNDADIGARAMSNGYDLRFTSLDGGVLYAHEIESFIITNGLCNAWIWIKIPTLSSINDTRIRMYYGRADSTNGENKTAVWDSNFVMVQHMNQTGTGAVGDYKDSTQYGNNSVNVTNQPTATTGQIDGAESFNGAGQYVDVGNRSSLNITSAMTLEAWIYPTNINGTFQGVLVKGDGGVSGFRISIGANSRPYIEVNNVSLHSIATLTNNNWYHIVTKADGSNFTIIVNGVSRSAPYTALPNITSKGVTIGSLAASFFNGTIDEVRISNTARSASWIATEYNNQSQPTEFSTLGIEEVLINEGDTIYISSNITLQEVGVGGEAIILNTDNFTISVTDTGSGTDGIDTYKTLSVQITDNSVGTDGVVINSTVTLSDSVAGSDVIAITAAILLSDSGNTTEILQCLVSAALADSGVGVDNIGIHSTLAINDSGLGGDDLLASISA